MQVAQLRDVIPTFHALGAELALVGNGTVAHARAFRDEEAVAVPLYTDPSLAAFDAAGLVRGVGSLLSPSAAGRAVKALAQGFRQSAVHGSAVQQGGAFVVGTGGELALSHVSRSPGDHPSPSDLVAALRRVTRAT